MTYSDIIGEVANNLGYEGLSNQLERPIKYAIFWALQDLCRNSNALRTDYEFEIFENKKEYPLPQDFLKPRKVIISQNGQGLPSEEVEYEELVTYEMNVEPELAKRFKNTILYSFRKIGDGNSVFIYPTVNGKCYISYDQSINENIDITGQLSPPIPSMFHSAIIDGATYYLARKKIIEITKQNSPDLLTAWLEAVRTYGNTFKESKEAFTVYSQQRAEPSKIKGYNFYDKPEDYL